MPFFAFELLLLGLSGAEPAVDDELGSGDEAGAIADHKGHGRGERLHHCRDLA